MQQEFKMHAMYTMRYVVVFVTASQRYNASRFQKETKKFEYSAFAFLRWHLCGYFVHRVAVQVCELVGFTYSVCVARERAVACLFDGL